MPASRTARLLTSTRLCYLFTFRGEDFRLRFFPSRQSQSVWDRGCSVQTLGRFPRSFLRPGDIAIDVGANVGLFTVPMAMAVGSEGHVYAVEPHPRTFTYLQKNVALNRLSNTTLINTALGDRAGEVRFSSKPNDNQNHVDPTSPYDKTIKTKIVRLDDLGIEHDEITLLKIDTEGFEYYVLRGAVEILKKTRCVYYETIDPQLRRYGFDTLDLNEFLREQGFQIFAPSRGLSFAAIDHEFERTADYQRLLLENRDLFAVRDPDEFADRWRAGASA